MYRCSGKYTLVKRVSNILMRTFFMRLQVWKCTCWIFTLVTRIYITLMFNFLMFPQFICSSSFIFTLFTLILTTLVSVQNSYRTVTLSHCVHFPPYLPGLSTIENLKYLCLLLKNNKFNPFSGKHCQIM